MNFVRFWGIFSGLLISFSFHSIGWATEKTPFLIVADVDDTTKITNVQYPLPTIWNAFASEAVFGGMSELFTELSSTSNQISGATEKSPETPLIFITGSPPLLEDRLHSMFTAHEFPAYRLILRPNIFESVADYKHAKFEELAGKTTLPMIFLGDDTEFDPLVTTDFRQAHPNQTLAIYIHNVMNKVMPANVNHYFTAFDVAVAEVSAGRLNPAQAIRVGDAVLKARTSRLFPDFTVCPTARMQLPYPNSETAKFSDLDRMADRVATRLVQSCLKRNWTPRSQRPREPLRRGPGSRFGS